MSEPVVTTTMFTEAEKAAWDIAVKRGLAIEAADLRALLTRAAPFLLADEVRDHIAEQDAVHADLSQLLRVLGMGDHARPQSSHEVMLDAINEVGRIRTRLAELENAVSWNTSCTSCAAVLDSSIREHSRAEAAEEKLSGRERALERAEALLSERDRQRTDLLVENGQLRDRVTTLEAMAGD